MARRIASIGTPEALAVLVERLGKIDDQKKRLAILRGTAEAMKGRRQIAMPEGWPELFKKLAASEDPEIRSHAIALAVTFGDPKAMESLRKGLADMKADVGQRREAMQSLLTARDPKLAATLQKLVTEPALRREALRGLAAYDDSQTPGVILGIYSSLSIEEKRDALNTLVARPAYAKALLAAVAGKRIAATEIPAELIRNLRNVQDDDLQKQVAEVWGILRDTPED
ncbi:MAG: HEAT repeat domain-containing protein, partial [Planctomycetes bacterium]|nr:HEAT repeat domain-containing protein [Planctomycetota bacterium]